MSEPTKPPLTAADARALLEAETQERVQAFAAELQALVLKHRVEIAAVPQLTPEGRIVAQIQYLPR